MLESIFGLYIDITISYFLTFFLWSIKHSNMVYELFITFWKCQDTQPLFIYFGMYLVLTFIEKLFSIVCCLFLLY